MHITLFIFSGLTGDDYQKLILTTLAEFPGTFLALLLIDRLGRKKTLALQSAIFAVSMLCLVECGESREFIVLVLFTARGVAAGFFQTVYVYTPEVYQTKLRALAMGKQTIFLICSDSIIKVSCPFYVFRYPQCLCSYWSDDHTIHSPSDVESLSLLRHRRLRPAR